MFFEENQQVGMKHEGQLLLHIHLLFAAFQRFFHDYRYRRLTATPSGSVTSPNRGRVLVFCPINNWSYVLLGIEASPVHNGGAYGDGTTERNVSIGFGAA